jgi:hypothetical protein
MCTGKLFKIRNAITPLNYIDGENMQRQSGIAKNVAVALRWLHTREWAEKRARMEERARVLPEALAQARVEVQGLALAQGLAEVLAKVPVLVLALTLAFALGDALIVEGDAPLEEEEEEPLTEAEAEAGAEAQAQAQAHVQALAQARVEARAQARARGRGEARALVLALRWARTRVRARARARALADALAGWWMVAQGHKFTYGEMLADSRLKDIIYSINPDHRHRLARSLWRSQECWWLIQIIAPITRLPPELLHQIFLVIIDETSHSPLVLMRVCKLWHSMVTGMWASLNLGTTTSKHAVTRKLERNQWLLDVLVDTEIDRGDFTPSEGAYQAIFAAIEASSRWRSFVVETFPAPADLPEDLVKRGLQQCPGAAMSRLRTFRIKSACEMSPLLNHILRILDTSASGKLTTVEINSASVVSFLVPTYSSVFRSVTVLSLHTPGSSNPVDLLPHLHQLETLTASHLSLPLYHNDTNLPFVHTLRHLSLRAVSIQWMSGRTFHVLESCFLLFPLHRHVLHTFSTTLPNCKHLTFQGHPLDILDGVSAHNLTHLSVLCSCCDKLRGHRQLARFSSQALRESRLAPQILHISIEATSQAWTTALGFMSNLEELVIDNAKPSSLGAKVLQSLVVQPVHTNLSTSGGWNTPLASLLEQFGDRYRYWLQTSTLERWDTPLCPLLKRFGLRYRRWLRRSEHFALIPEIESIIRSREQSGFSLESFRIWKTGDQKDPLELIEGSGISKGFERLAREGATSGGNLL